MLLALLNPIDSSAGSIALWLLSLLVVAITWYAQGSGNYSSVTWNDDSMGGGSSGTPAAGDYADSNGHTVELDTTITGIIFSASGFQCTSGKTCTLRGCTFYYELVTGGTITIGSSGGYTVTEFTSAGRFDLNAGSLTIDVGATCRLSSGQSTAALDIVCNGTFEINCGSAAVQLTFASGKKFTGTGVLDLQNVSSSHTSYPVAAGAHLYFYFQAPSGGGAGRVYTAGIPGAF